MNISLRCFGALSKGSQCHYGQDRTIRLVEELRTVRDLANQIHIAENDIAIVFINGKTASVNDRLAEGDQVALSPPSGGM